MKKKLFIFSSRSAMSFALVHKGREMYVDFSQKYNNQSHFNTDDEGLADKIRQHRWFREGRIKMEIVEVEEAVEQPKVKIPEPEKNPTYSILGKSMAANIPTPNVPCPEANAEESTNADEDQKPKDEGQSPTEENEENEGQSTQASLEEVTSFMEAKEFLANLGVERNKISSKTKMAEVCREMNIEFPNFPLE